MGGFCCQKKDVTGLWVEDGDCIRTGGSGRMAMMEGSDSGQRIIYCQGKAVRETLEGIGVEGRSMRGAGGNSVMNGSSVLGLENRKMLMSLSTKRVAFWKMMF